MGERHVQDGDADGHDGDGGLGERPDRQVDALVRDVWVGHGDDQYRFDDAGCSGAGWSQQKNGCNRTLSSLTLHPSSWPLRHRSSHGASC